MLYSVNFVGEILGWAVGKKGTILHTTNGGVTFINNEINNSIQQSFILNQNYPNPFNPSTTITYHLPKASNVVLKIYDVLGNEVATLVNEEKAPGTYEVMFNSESSIRHPASGVYFYQLKAGDYLETKKMILLK